MDKDFIINAFKKMGEHPLNVKLMRDKYTNEIGYAFVTFCDSTSVIQKLDGLFIPDTNPVRIYYRLILSIIIVVI